MAIDIDNMLLQRFNTLIWGFGGVLLDLLFLSELELYEFEVPMDF